VGFIAYGKSCRLSHIASMLWRERSSRGRPLNAPAAFIHPCQPIVAKQPPGGLRAGAHELKHDGYRLQIHVREGRGQHKKDIGGDTNSEAEHIRQQLATPARKLTFGSRPSHKFHIVHSPPFNSAVV
jgi:hypothetical protein